MSNATCERCDIDVGVRFTLPHLHHRELKRLLVQADFLPAGMRVDIVVPMDPEVHMSHLEI